MKRCPECQRGYGDELFYCLTDGCYLSPAAEPEITQAAPTRIEPPTLHASAPPKLSPKTEATQVRATQPVKRRRWRLKLLISLLLGIAAVSAFIAWNGIPYSLQPSFDTKRTYSREDELPPSLINGTATPRPKVSQKPPPAPVQQEPRPPATPPPPVTYYSGELIVMAGNSRGIPIMIQPNGFRGVLSGELTVSGGSRDIGFAVLPQGAGAHGGFSPIMVYGYRPFTLPLSPGRYLVFFDNRHAAIIGKTLNVFIQVRYE